MSFNSLHFALVFPFIFLIYWAVPRHYNQMGNLFLLLVSYWLYMLWKPAFAFVLLGISLLTYIGALMLDIFQNHRKRTVCIVFTVLGLLPLLVVKFCNFRGIPLAVVGLSFFTFQAVGYLLDVYHRRIPAEKNLPDYLLFVSFFPQVTSGPISTAAELMPQIKNQRSFDSELAIQGMKMMLWGLFLKMVIADRIGIYVDTVYSNYEHCSGSVCFLASILYTIRIYCDFAGYSLMAIGISGTLGFRLTDNFRRPYLAASVTEFWRRWHITLTRWLTTHVYINLGGSRCSTPRQYFNIMITFLVSGLWHGANWTFIFWGGIHGAFQIIEKALFGRAVKAELQTKTSFSIVRVLRILLTFNLVSLAWIFFRMPTFHDAAALISRFFTDFSPFTIAPMDKITLVCLCFSIPILVFYDVLHEYSPDSSFLRSKPLQWTFYLTITVLTLSIGVLDSGQFIYVSF